MNNLKLHYSVERKDIEVEDKKIVLKYFNIIKKHKKLDLRINDINPNKELLSINAISINKIFSYLGNELPEEFILFLYDKTGKDSNDYGYIINKGKQKEQEDMDEEKKEFLTLEIENPVLKKYRTLTYQIMKKYYFIFCIISFIIAILFTLHLFSYLIDKEVS
jgi:hypothetical protein